MLRKTINYDLQFMRIAIYLQVSWAVLSMCWNIAGLYLIGQGQRAPGPTASLLAAGLLLVIAIILILAWRSKWSVNYIVVSALAGVMALLAVINAFTADPFLWPSEFWRYAGEVLNTLGVTGAVLAIVGIIKSKLGNNNG